MYEAPREDPRPYCEYCGAPITEHPQRCSALPTEDDPSGESGYCHPRPYQDPAVTTEVD